MINTHDNVWVPSDGYKYISNGSCYSDMIRLGTKDNIANWHDTNDEPPELPKPEEEPTVEDKAEAYDILTGVSE